MAGAQLKTSLLLTKTTRRQTSFTPNKHTLNVSLKELSLSHRTLSRRRNVSFSVSASSEGDIYDPVVLPGGMVDYYQLLQVEPTANTKEIKSAYYRIAKECHPDVYGPGGTELCVLLNAAYETLSDYNARADFDARIIKARINQEDGYTGELLSAWHGTPEENRAVFVDECTCIGCLNCMHEAPGTFANEPEFGRARVFAQWADEEEQIEIAVESCPVDCIHWVDKDQLPVLEHCMQKLDKVNVGIMNARQGAVGDVFAAAATFAKRRAETVKEEMKANRETAAQQAARRSAAEEIRRRTSGFRNIWPRVSRKQEEKSREPIPVDRSLTIASPKKTEF